MIIAARVFCEKSRVGLQSGEDWVWWRGEQLAVKHGYESFLLPFHIYYRIFPPYPLFSHRRSHPPSHQCVSLEMGVKLLWVYWTAYVARGQRNSGDRGKCVHCATLGGGGGGSPWTMRILCFALPLTSSISFAQELHLWSIEDEVSLLRTFNGHTNGHYILRACFGGACEDFVVCGSEGEMRRNK